MQPTAETVSNRSNLRPAIACLFVLSIGAAIIYALPWMWAVKTYLVFGRLGIDLTDKDFINYWMAGRLTLSGDQLELFNHDIYFARLQELFGSNIQIRSWSYPPHYLLFLWPLGYLSYVPALVAYLAVTFAFFVLAVCAFRKQVAPELETRLLVFALAGYVFMMVDATQNGFFSAAAFLFGLAYMRTRPAIAGLAFACLTIKPQLGVLIPALLLFDRNWRAILWSAVFTALLVGLSLLFFGIESWHDYLAETVPYQRSVMTDWYGIFLRMMPTVFASIRTWGFPPDVAGIVQWPVSVAALAIVIWILSQERDPLRRIFAVVCGTFLVTPYAFNYDMGALSVVAAALLLSPRMVGNLGAALLVALTAALAGVVTNLGRAGLPVSPLVLAATLLLVAAQGMRGRTDFPVVMRTSERTNR